MSEKKTFEEKMERLDFIANELESATKPMEELVKLFDEGMVLSKECRVELMKIESHIKQVIRDTEEEIVDSKPLDLDI